MGGFYFMLSLISSIFISKVAATYFYEDFLSTVPIENPNSNFYEQM